MQIIKNLFELVSSAHSRIGFFEIHHYMPEYLNRETEANDLISMLENSNQSPCTHFVFGKLK